jgi:hypothetical protein
LPVATYLTLVPALFSTYLLCPNLPSADSPLSLTFTLSR